MYVSLRLTWSINCQIPVRNEIVGHVVSNTVLLSTKIHLAVLEFIDAHGKTDKLTD